MYFVSRTYCYVKCKKFLTWRYSYDSIYGKIRGVGVCDDIEGLFNGNDYNAFEFSGWEFFAKYEARG